MSMRAVEIVTQYHVAAKMAFNGNRDGYIEALMTTNYGKHGNMRSTMSAPIAGSMRLIARTQKTDKHSVFISENLCSKIRVCRKTYNSDGIENEVYTEGPIQEGDWIMLVRPPPLTIANTQPLKVRYWDLECIGIHPETFTMFHGDYDGDEAQVTPIFDKDSISECEQWTLVPFQNFKKARELYNSLAPDLQKHESPCSESSMAFIENTTLSAKQLKNGTADLVFGDLARMKKEHILGMKSRFGTGSYLHMVVEDSIRGMNDVGRQQLSQGSIGSMSRTARIAASCFFRPSSGGLYVVTRTGEMKILNDGIADVGCPSVRGIMNLCSKAQQAALDSHRAQTSVLDVHDMISDLLLGCERDTLLGPTSKYTLVYFDVQASCAELEKMHARWKRKSDDSYQLYTGQKKLD
ncbi:MAG: hypothetical protein Q9187_001227 [Circinaria calcarea]